MSESGWRGSHTEVDNLHPKEGLDQSAGHPSKGSGGGQDRRAKTIESNTMAGPNFLLPLVQFVYLGKNGRGRANSVACAIHTLNLKTGMGKKKTVELGDRLCSTLKW